MTIRHLNALFLILLLADPLAADNWPQWRGLRNDGVSAETNIPSKWSDKENIAWKLDMPGMSGATPCVWNDRIFVTSANDAGELMLICVSTEGKELWRKTLGKGDKGARGGEGNSASPSPTTDGKHVYACFGTGDLACLDFDGKIIWQVDLQKEYGKFKYGFGFHTTPVLHGDRIYLQLIHSKPAHVIALDKATGKLAWKVERDSDGHSECYHSYASPLIWQNGKDAYLVAHGNDYATAHQLADGKEIWRCADLNPKSNYNATLRFVASPLATPDLIIIPTAKNGPVVGVKPDAKGLINAGGDGEVWRRGNNTPDVPSPLLHEGLVYLCRESGVLICMDAKTGKEHYQQRIHNQRHRASPVYADGKIYCAARDGVVTVVKAGEQFELIATNKLGDDLAASPAISGGRIYLRGFGALWAVGK